MTTFHERSGPPASEDARHRVLRRRHRHVQPEGAVTVTVAGWVTLKPQVSVALTVTG